jgi:tellurite resistance protein TehA-like permease
MLLFFGIQSGVLLLSLIIVYGFYKSKNVPNINKILVYIILSIFYILMTIRNIVYFKELF